MERKMARDLDRYITGNYGEKQMRLPAHTCVDRPELPCDACGTKYTVNAAECVRLCEAMAAYWGDGVCEAPIHPGAYLTDEDIPIRDLVRAAVGWRKP